MCTKSGVFAVCLNAAESHFKTNVYQFTAYKANFYLSKTCCLCLDGGIQIFFLLQICILFQLTLSSVAILWKYMVKWLWAWQNEQAIAQILHHACMQNLKKRKRHDVAVRVRLMFALVSSECDQNVILRKRRLTGFCIQYFCNISSSEIWKYWFVHILHRLHEQLSEKGMLHVCGTRK